ncbi:adenylate/guanylate cyclase domain-containing protein [Hyalangium rubrum]|uniref:Adenylate/guanylate cyclase domain-containing protein n=1 Tax=Hyalangium rubrum TaxID=3103134 RepID=A0ABU5H379_9BACT|nr:adenylate/guanylate cyclase domain-containing protein [Hyalangium sp. s54d21]MDY7227559.1 adenylate/guanylate cyclase domain-containing protein [Hyalangium sp. s54d21]
MPVLQLIMNPGLSDEQVFPLGPGSTLIGRDPENQVSILHKSLSRHHARLETSHGKVVLTDLDSKNGTFIRGTRVKASCELQPGDTFTCGAVHFRLVAQSVEQVVNPTMTHTAPTLSQVSMQELLGGLGLEGSRTSALKLSALAEAERGRDKLQILLKVSQLLSSPGTIDSLMERSLNLVFQILEVDRAVILLVEPRTGALLPRVTRTSEEVKSPGQIYSKHIVNYVQQHGVAALFSDARLDPRLETSESVMQQSIYAAMCAPLKVRDELLGVLYVDNLRIPERFSQEDLEFLSSFANQVAIALENSMLYRRIEQEAVVRSNYQRFFPPSALKRLEQSSSGMVLGARETEVTTLFSDIAGFTQMSSRMRPIEVVDMLNEYFPVMADIVFEQEGTLEKYIGDALMAIWGAPFSHPDDADRALWAAVRMQQELVPLNERRRARQQEEIRVHIGLNTGPVAAGNIGSNRFLQYATIGDTTNVASRVCSAAQSGEVLITQSTYDRLVERQRWKLELLPPVQVKGKDAPLTLYRVDWRDMKAPGT